MAIVGGLLKYTLDKLQTFPTAAESVHLAAAVGSENPDNIALPIVVKVPTIPPLVHEPWRNYRGRVLRELENIQNMLRALMGLDAFPLVTANSLRTSATPDQIDMLSRRFEIELIDLDPLVQVAAMDNVIVDIDLATFNTNHAGLAGQGVSVAVLDSGIDLQHPDLVVTDSVSTCGEAVDIPGSHGTHCAGSIASRHATYPGVAPEVTLLNIKVLRANGTGQHTFITNGIDEALNRGAHVLSMSLGFNHLPTWSQNGHGWDCKTGGCPLCTAVDNATALGALVVVAAGNEHDRADALRQFGYGHEFDTELGCPGQAREALTVGAITKSTFLPASFSSRGPTAYATAKPDLTAPGVNVWSTVPVPRDAQGVPVPNPAVSDRFGRKSGTSMATPIVAGTAALIVQRRMQAGIAWIPADIKAELLANGIVAMPSPPNVVGAGRLSLTNL